MGEPAVKNLYNNCNDAYEQLWTRWAHYDKLDYHLSFPSYICSEAQVDIVSWLEEYIWFTICGHSLRSTLVFETYSFSLGQVITNKLFIPGRWLRSYASALIVGIQTIRVGWTSSYIPACPGFLEVLGAAVTFAELNVKHNAKSFLLIYIILLLLSQKHTKTRKIKAKFCSKDIFIRECHRYRGCNNQKETGESE